MSSWEHYFTGEVSRWVGPPHCCEFIVQRSHRCCSVLLLLAASSTSRPSRGVSRREARLETSEVTHPVQVTRLRLTRSLQVWMNMSLDRCKSKPKTQTELAIKPRTLLDWWPDNVNCLTNKALHQTCEHLSTIAVFRFKRFKVYFCLLMAMCPLQMFHNRR